MPRHDFRLRMTRPRVVALNHPNIVAVYDVGEGYIVSELVDGEPLRGGKLGLCKTMEVAAQIASGLAAAHDLGFALSQVGAQSGSQRAIVATPGGPSAWVRRAVASAALLAAGVAGTRLLWRDAAVPAWTGMLLGGPERSSAPPAIPSGNGEKIVSIPRSGSGAARTLFTLTNQLSNLDAGPDGSIYLDQMERPVPLVATAEENSGPVTAAGASEIAFLIGPQPKRTIAMAAVSNGRITRRIPFDKPVWGHGSALPRGRP